MEELDFDLGLAQVLESLKFVTILFKKVVHMIDNRIRDLL